MVSGVSKGSYQSYALRTHYTNPTHTAPTPVRLNEGLADVSRSLFGLCCKYGGVWLRVILGSMMCGASRNQAKKLTSRASRTVVSQPSDLQMAQSRSYLNTAPNIRLSYVIGALGIFSLSGSHQEIPSADRELSSQNATR